MQISSGATGAGGATRVVMRGMKSLTKNNNALYAVSYTHLDVYKRQTARTDCLVVC